MWWSMYCVHAWKAVLTVLWEIQGKWTAGSGSKGPELSPCKLAGGHKGVRASHAPRGVPYLTMQVLRSLLPVTCCSGGEEARACPPKRMHWLSLGGSGLIPRCSSGQHGNAKLLMLCKVVGCLGQSRDPLLTMTQKCITSLQRTEFATGFCLRSGTTLWQFWIPVRIESNTTDGWQSGVNAIYSVGTGTWMTPECY